MSCKPFFRSVATPTSIKPNSYGSFAIKTFTHCNKSRCSSSRAMVTFFLHFFMWSLFSSFFKDHLRGFSGDVVNIMTNFFSYHIGQALSCVIELICVCPVVWKKSQFALRHVRAIASIVKKCRQFLITSRNVLVVDVHVNLTWLRKTKQRGLIENCNLFFEERYAK